MPYELLVGPDGLRRAEPSWRQLEDRLAVHPYQTATFARLWYEHIGARISATPLIVTYREDETVRGIFPACILPYGPVKLLTWMGAPLLQDYGDILWDPSARIPAEQFVTEALALLKRQARAAFLYMSNVRHDAVAFDPLSRLLSEYKTSAAPYVEVPEDCGVYLVKRPKGDNSRTPRRRLRRFERVENASFDVLGPNDPELDDALTWLFERKKERFQGKRGKSDLHLPGHEAFRRAQAHEQPGMRICRLRVDGKTIATDLSCLRQGRLYGMLLAFDPAAASLSPGVVLTFHILKYCRAEGIDVYDLGWGTAPDKYLWTGLDMPMTTFVSADLRGRLLVSAAKARRAFAQRHTTPMPQDPPGQAAKGGTTR